MGNRKDKTEKVWRFHCTCGEWHTIAFTRQDQLVRIKTCRLHTVVKWVGEDLTVIEADQAQKQPKWWSPIKTGWAARNRFDGKDYDPYWYWGTLGGFLFRNLFVLPMSKLRGKNILKKFDSKPFRGK